MRYNFEVLLMSLKQLTISFPEVSVFSDIKHSGSVSYINDASAFLSSFLISRRKNPLEKLIPHSHGMKVLTHFNILVYKKGKPLSFPPFFPNKLVSLYVSIFICKLFCMLVCQYFYQCMKNVIFCRVDTAQFWFMYIDMMKMQYQKHTAVQENNYHLQLHALQQFLPLQFNFNMHSYARYCAYYAEVLLQIDTLHSDLKDTLSRFIYTSPRPLPSSNSCRPKGEQTITRDEKTSGGIRNVASSSFIVLKWSLNR